MKQLKFNINSRLNQFKIVGIKKKNLIPKIIAVSKTSTIDHILPLIEHGHLDFGRIKFKRQLKNGQT